MIKNYFHFILSILIIGLFFILKIKNRQDQHHFDINIPICILKDGDIIFRRGETFISDTIADLSVYDKRFSHVGIIRKIDTLVSVIHAEGSSNPKDSIVKEESLNSFWMNAKSVGIYRVNELDGHNISTLATEFLGLPFDWNFDLNDDTQLYCTELVYIIIRSINPEMTLSTVWVDEVNRFVIPIDAISLSGFFAEIGYWEK